MKCKICKIGYKVDANGKCEIGIEKCIKPNSTDANLCD